MLEGAVVGAETPRALASTLDDLDTELVLAVGLQLVDVLVEVRAVQVLVLGVGGAAEPVAHRVQAAVAVALVPTQARVCPRHDDGRRRQADSFQADRWRHRRLRFHG